MGFEKLRTDYKRLIIPFFSAQQVHCLGLVSSAIDFEAEKKILSASKHSSLTNYSETEMALILTRY